MDQGFSNYLFGTRQSLAISQVQSHHPSITTQNQSNHFPHQPDSEFYDIYNYSSNVLKTWGITVGILTPSRQNTKTVNALMEMIRLRQKDLDYKEKIKEDVAKSEYEKEMMKNKIRLTQEEMNEYRKKLGVLENKYKEEEVRFRRELKAITLQKQELVQIRMKLEQKNTQICHEMKKKETEMNKVKDSMKKGGEKVLPKNAFDLIAAVSGEVGEQSTSKYTVMKEKYENERKYYLRENSILRDQLSDAENIINDFISFLRENCQMKALQELNMHPNHPVDYNEGRLLQRLHQTIQNVKSNLLNIAQQPAKLKPILQPPQVPSKPLKRANTLQTAPKLNQSVGQKITTNKQPQEDYFRKVMKDDISIISHIEVKDIEMPMKGKVDYDKWDILYDSGL